MGLLLGIHVRDLDCAFKLFRREVVERLCLTATGACISAEIMVQCTRGRLRIGEVPVTHYPRYQGVPSGAAIRVIWRAFRELPSLWRYRRIEPLAPAPFPSRNGRGRDGQATSGTPLDAIDASETQISVTSPTH